MHTRARLLRLALLSLLVLAIGVGDLASARYVRPASAPSGRYGAVRGDELIGFKVLPNRTVKAFFFNMRMECHNSDTGEDYIRYFDAHNIGGGTVNFNGNWRREYEAESGLRQGNGAAQVEFRRNGRVVADVTVFVPGGGESYESCYGYFATRVKRGPLS